MPVPQARLLVSKDACETKQRLDVGKRVVRSALRHVVRAREIFEPEARRAVVADRPFDPVRAQRIAHAREIDDVPARVVVLPFARIRIVEVAVEQVPRELVVEAQRVVADAAGAGLGEDFVHVRRELGFDDALDVRALRRDAGDEARAGRGQHVGRGLAEDRDRIADDLELGCRADCSELSRTIAARIGAERLVVVPEESLHRASVAGRASVAARTCA